MFARLSLRATARIGVRPLTLAQALRPFSSGATKPHLIGEEDFLSQNPGL